MNGIAQSFTSLFQLNYTEYGLLGSRDFFWKGEYLSDIRGNMPIHRALNCFNLKHIHTLLLHKGNVQIASDVRANVEHYFRLFLFDQTSLSNSHSMLIVCLKGG